MEEAKSSSSKKKKKITLLGRQARKRQKEKKTIVDKEMNAIADYLEAKRKTMEKIQQNKEEETTRLQNECQNASRMADLEYRSAYLRNWIQLSNSGVPHDVIASVLPPPDGIQLPTVPAVSHKKKKAQRKSRKKRRCHTNVSSSSDYSSSTEDTTQASHK